MTVYRVLPVMMSIVLMGSWTPMAFAADSQPDVNFKIYSPGESPVGNEPNGTSAPDADSSNDQTQAGEANANKSAGSVSDNAGSSANNAQTSGKPVNTAGAATGGAEEPVLDNSSATNASESNETSSADTKGDSGSSADGKQVASSKTLQGYIRVVPVGTKVPIIIDTAIDTDTSQEGDEFSARTAEDLTIDGATVVPAGSIIKGRIAQMNAARHLNRSGSVALKFDSVTTPDNRQLPLVANIVARGGVVHARRGMKDVMIDTGTIVIPVAVGLGIGVLAGAMSNSNSTSTTGTTTSSNGVGAAGGALIGAGVGVAVGVIILLAKKGKKVDIRPGDELKIELAEDLRMPM